MSESEPDDTALLAGFWQVVALRGWHGVTMGRVAWRDILWTAAGALSVAIAVFGTLALMGGASAFVTMLTDLLPRYAAFHRSRARSRWRS